MSDLCSKLCWAQRSFRGIDESIREGLGTMPSNGDFFLNPEAAALVRRQFELDYEEAGPKAQYSVLVHKGVRIESRWDVRREFDVMKGVIDALPELMARRVSWMWCDSNCGSNFVVGVKGKLYVDELRWSIADAIVKVNGGHNGIRIEDGESAFAGSVLTEFDPDWGDF